MEYDTSGDQTNLQVSSDSGQEVKMIFPMVGENTMTDTVPVAPPQSFVLPSELDEENGVEGQRTSTAGDRCPVIEIPTAVHGTTDEGSAKGSHTDVKLSSSVAGSDNSARLGNCGLVSSCDSANYASSHMPVEKVDKGNQEENVIRNKNHCQTHPDESVTTYCQTCNRLVCLECLVEDDTHGSHKKITIKKLLATPQFFAETSQGLSKLLGNKEQYLENLKQAAKNIDLGHDSQLKAIRDMEKKTLEELDRGLEAETEKLKAASKKQENQIKDVARFAVEAVERHLEDQTFKNQAERDRVETALPTLCDLISTMRKEPCADILYDLVAGYQRSEQILKNETGDLVVTGVETKAEKVDGKGMEKFTELTVKVVDMTAHATDLQTRMRAIVPDCMATYSKGNRKEGSVVVCKDYFTTCCNFGLQLSTLLPGCYQEPNFTNPIDTHNGLIFVDPSDAKSLSCLFGGNPNMTVHRMNNQWIVKNHVGIGVSYMVWIHDAKGKYIVLTTAENTHRSASVFLPVSSNLHCALESYLGWRPSRVECRQSKASISSMLTVGEWGCSTSSCRLTVIE